MCVLIGFVYKDKQSLQKQKLYPGYSDVFILS